MENISALSRTAPASSLPYYVCTRSVPKNDGTNHSQTTFELRDGNNSRVDVGNAAIPVAVLTIPQPTSPSDHSSMWAIINSQGAMSVACTTASVENQQSRQRDTRDIYRFLYRIADTMAEYLRLASHNDDAPGEVDVVAIAGPQEAKEEEEAQTLNLGKMFLDGYLGTSAPYPDQTYLCNYAVNLGPTTQLKMAVNIPSYILRGPSERSSKPTPRVVKISVAQKATLNAAVVLEAVPRFKIVYKY